jgi:hypothetical protein
MVIFIIIFVVQIRERIRVVGEGVRGGVPGV